MTYIFVSRPDQLAVVDQFLHAVRAPAGNAGDREDRREELNRNPEHIIDKPGIEVHVAADRLGEFSSLCQKPCRNLLH